MISPGPPTLPFLGNIHQVPKAYTHLKFTEWSKLYGGLFTLKLGTATMAVITDRRIAKDLDKKANIYSQRPDSYVSHDLITKGNHLLVMHYGNQWRTFRKLIHQHLMEKMCDQEHIKIVDAEALQLAIDYMLYPEQHMKHPKRFSNSVTNTVVFGIRTPHVKAEYMNRLYTMMESWSEIMETGATPPVDIYPFLKRLPERWFGNYVTRAKAIGAGMDSLYSDILGKVEARRATGKNIGSFMDRVLDQQGNTPLPPAQLRFIGGVLMEGGSDTSSSLIIAIVQAMIQYPHVQRKAQAELDRVVGVSRSPAWSDLADLPYINAIVKEGHRWRPILPLNFPHALTEDDRIDGKFLPKGTIVIFNTWGMHMNDTLWESPADFVPERYANHKLLAPEYIAMGGDWKNRDHYGYGFGRRSCPGIHLAERNMFLAIAKLLWALRFEPKVADDGHEVPIDSSPDQGYHQGFLYCAKDYECQVTVRSEMIRETLLREFDEARTNVFSQFAES